MTPDMDESARILTRMLRELELSRSQPARWAALAVLPLALPPAPPLFPMPEP